MVDGSGSCFSPPDAQGLFADPLPGPEWLRISTIVVLGLYLGIFAIGSLKWRCHEMLRPLARIQAGASTVISVLMLCGVVYGALSRRNITPEPGGWLYSSFLVLMVLWWGTSLVRAKRESIRSLFTTSQTFRPQVWATALAFSLVFCPPYGAIAVATNLPWWVLSVTCFLFAVTIMVADTDYQYAASPDPVEHSTWFAWRLWNYALIIIYVGLAVMVLHGMPLRYAAGCGCGLSCLLLGVTVWKRETV